MNIITIPWMGSYTAIILAGLRRLGLKTVAPPLTTSRTVSIGVKAMHELMCLPAKVTLGNIVQAGERGATDALVWDTCGSCRLKCYYILHRQALAQMDNPIRVHPVRFSHLIGDLHRVDPSIGAWPIVKETYRTLKNIYNFDRKLWGQESEPGAIKIGLMGEIYTVNDPAVNMDLVKKLKKLGAYVSNVIHLSHFALTPFYKNHLMPMPFTDIKVWKASEKRAHRLFPKAIGGHGNTSITALYYYHALGYNGAIHVLPFPCMPEATVADIMDIAAAELNLPLLHLIFDEHSGDAGLTTRLEAFVDMLRFRKCGWG